MVGLLTPPGRYHHVDNHSPLLRGAAFRSLLGGIDGA
jgi:hypothetical protein